MSAGIGAASQTVDIGLRLVPDSGNAAVGAGIVAQIDKLNERAKQAFEAIAKSSEDTTAKIEHAWSEMAEKIIRSLEKMADKAVASQESSRTKIELLIEQSTRRTVSVQEDGASRVAKAHETSHTRIEASFTRLQGKVREQEAAHENLAKTTVEGADHMIRSIKEISEGLSKAGIISEEDSKKFSHMFDGIQGVVSVFSGIISIIETTVKLTKEWKAALAAVKLEEEAILVIEEATALAGGGKGGKAGGSLLGALGKGALGAAEGVAGSAVENAGFRTVIAGTLARAFPTLTSVGSSVGSAVAAHAAPVGLGVLGGLGLFEVNQLGRRLTHAAGDAVRGKKIDWGKTLWSEEPSGPQYSGVGGYARNMLGYVGGSNNESFAHAVSGWWQASSGAKEGEEKTGRMQAEADARKQEAARRDEIAIARGEFERSTRARQREMLGNVSPELQRQFDTKELADAQKNMKGVDDRAAGLRKNFAGYTNYGEQVAGLERLKTAQENVLERDRKRTEELKQQRDRQADLVKGYEEQIDAAKRLVAEEKQRSQSRKADFGRLSKTDRNQLLMTVNRIKQGKANDADYRLLDRMHYGKALSDTHFAGSVTKEEEEARQFLEPDGVSDAMTNLAKTQAAAQRAKAGLTATDAQYQGSKQKMAASASALAGTVKREDDVEATHRNLTPADVPTAKAAASAVSQSFEEAFVKDLIPAMTGLCQRMASLINNAGALS